MGGAARVSRLDRTYGVGVGGGTAVRCVGHVVLTGNRVVSILLDQKEASFCKRQLPG